MDQQVKGKLDALSRLLKNPGFALTALAASLLLLAVYSFTSNWLLVGPVLFNPFAEPVSVLLVVLLSIGGGLLAAMIIWRRENTKRVCATGVGGGSLGLIASACPYCPPLAGYFLGAQSLYFLSAYGKWIAAAAAGITFYAWLQGLQAGAGV